MRRRVNTSRLSHWAFESTYRVVSVRSVPKSTFRQKIVVLRYAGSTNNEGISYRWSTTFTLKRIKFTP
jgi:hypothetical protein